MQRAQHRPNSKQEEFSPLEITPCPISLENVPQSYVCRLRQPTQAACGRLWRERMLKLKLKLNKALDENSSLSYGTSPAIWDHTVLPATRHKWTRPALTPASKLVLECETVAIRNLPNINSVSWRPLTKSHLVHGRQRASDIEGPPLSFFPFLSSLFPPLSLHLPSPLPPSSSSFALRPLSPLRSL